MSETKKPPHQLSQISEEPKKQKKKPKNKNSSSSSESQNSKDQKVQKKNQILLKDLIAENFVTLTMIGKGAFGQIYLSYDMRDNIEVSIKKELKRAQKQPQLKTEAKIYQSLLNINSQDITGAKALAQDEIQGVPHFYGMGELVDSFYLIIEFLGPNLIELFNYCGYHKFTISTVCLLGLQMMNRIEYLHKHNFIHRDIKPENFLIGTKSKSNIVFLLDFGLSKRYKNIKNHQHIPYREGRPLTGTARYVSINTHLGIEQSRRDDLESIGYLLIFFLKGSLPWQGLKAGGDKYQRIMEKKLQIPTEILCFGLPDEIVYYLNYCKSLRFEDRPDYDYLRGLFIKLLGTCNSMYGLTKEMLKFDWCFHDPSNSIWQIYTKKGKGNNANSNSINVESKDNNDNSKDKNKNGDFRKQLSSVNEVHEDKDHYTKTNENNPNMEISEESESSSDMNINNNNNSKKNSGNVKKNSNNEMRKNINDNNNNKNKDDVKSSIEEESEETIKEDFNGMKLNTQNLDNDDIDNSFKNIFIGENKEEDIDKYINKLLNKKGIQREISKTQSNKLKNSNLNNINKTTSNNIKISNTYNLNNSNNNMNLNSMNIKTKSSNLFKNEEINLKNSTIKEEMTPEIGGKNVNPRDSLDISDLNGENHKNSFSPEEIKKKIEDADKLIGNKHDSVLEKNTYRNSQIIQLEELSKIQHQQGEVENIRKSKSKSKTQKPKNIQFKLKDEIIEDKKEKENNDEIEKERKKTLKETDLWAKKESFENLIKEKKNSKKLVVDSLIGGTNITKDLVNISKENLVKILTEPISKNYIIISDLGQGSYGQVKKVRHRKLNEIRAMKITNKKTESSKVEIEILRKISHPNITNIFEIYEDSRKYYIMMEFLQGGELFEAITSSGSFSELSAAKVMKQLLSAVNYLHTNRIVHRDLKPENIMLTNEPRDGNYEIKLIDFGASRNFIPGKKINKFIGTSYYIAPEVLKENYDEKCDVWSCGVILYILLCGYPPFNGNTNIDIYHNIQTQHPIFSGEEWEEITPEAISLIKNMLNKNPQKRFSAEMCLEHKWFTLVEQSEKNNNINSNFKQIQIHAISHMAQFVQENRFKKAVLQFISSQFDIQKEESELKEIFKSLDTSGKGQLSQKIFTDKLIQLYGENDGKVIGETIFSNLDLDGSGQISYDEFLSAMINSKKIVTDERLEKAFKMFDKDNSGRLSIHEIISVFGGDEESWKKVISEIDLNKDGEVDFNEFKIMMTNIDKNVGISQNIKSKLTEVKPNI